MAFLSDRSKFAENPIEEEDKFAASLMEKGRKIYSLSRGDPSKYFPTPKYIIRAYQKALDDGFTSYAASGGVGVIKDAVIRRYSRRYKLKLGHDDIIVTSGLSEALLFLNSALINDSDMALLFRPYYSLYYPNLKVSGGKALLQDYDEQNGWAVHTENLRKELKEAKRRGITARIKYMIITNPNNPTGTVLKRSDLEEVVEIANEYGILLISDEIYDEIVYNKARFTSVSEVSKGVPHVILNGASKDYDSPGFRIGFVIIPEKDKKSELLKGKIYDFAMMRLCANVPAQYAIAEAMNNVSEHNKAIRSMVKAIEERANHATKILNENPLFSTVEPNGAFYVLPRIDLSKLRIKDDRQFVDLLLKKEGIQVTRGSGFGAESHFRVVALPTKEILDYSINKINAFCRKYSK